MPRFLTRLTDAAFADIPNKAVPRTVRLADPTLTGPRAIGWILVGYCDKLLNKNDALREVLGRFAGRFDDPECLRCLTAGQRILLSLSTLDGQVRNGGVAQFFWNRPDFILEASESLGSLGEVGLASAYDRAVKALVGKRQDWVDLRKRAGPDLDGFWGPFRATYDLLDLGWFDDAYFDRHGAALVSRLVSYVQSHKAEVIEA